MSFVPFVATPPDVVKKMLELANVNSQDVLYDLGSGDGRILITAIKEFGVKKAVGVELREDLAKNTIEEVKRQYFEDKIEVINNDFHKVMITGADVITLFLTTAANERLKPKFEKELKNGTRIISHDYEIVGWKPAKSENLGQHTLYLYVMRK